MKSPITGKEMMLTYEWKTITFRKESFDIKYQFYLCEDSGEHFTTTELDELNMKLVHNLYRVKHHIPSVEEIHETRVSYGLSAARMSEILGFGPNTYRLYESGDVPSIPNANLIKTARSPHSFRDLVYGWLTGDANTKHLLLHKADRMIDAQKKKRFEIDFSNYLMGVTLPDEYSGFRKPSLEKLTEMVVFFAHKISSYKTKMNKLLFYADFACFRSFGHSVSGTRYNAIPYGPVPDRYESIFEKLTNEDVIDCIYEELPKGSQREELKGREDRPFNPEVFKEEELEILHKVAARFQNITTKAIVDLSHEEPGWIENLGSKGHINYHYAFDLKGI
jgi:putative zinc finger/helix-turn-helix YgiT family protein